MFIIAIAVVMIEISSAFVQFTSSANESITFELKYDWGKNYQYGVLMALTWKRLV